MINLFTFSFSHFDPNKEQDATPRLLGIEERLSVPACAEHGRQATHRQVDLMLLPLKSSINLIQLSSSLDTCLIKCPHLPSDIEARRGVRRSKEDPSKLEYIFGYDKMTLTLKNPLLGIELPSDSITRDGFASKNRYLFLMHTYFS